MALTRREVLKTPGITTGGLLLSNFKFGEDTRIPLSAYDDNPLFKKPAKPITAITCSAGSRRNMYGNYALAFPNLTLSEFPNQSQYETNATLKNIILKMKINLLHRNMFLIVPSLPTLL